MGLSASQARLLSITARLSDNELHSQQIANAKVRLADQTQEASREYVNALDAQKLVYTMYDAKGNSTQVNLTPAVMYDFSELKNQYGISNTAGQLLISSTDAQHYKNSPNLIKFLQSYGVEMKHNDEYDKMLEIIYSDRTDFYDPTNPNRCIDLEYYDEEKNNIAGLQMPTCTLTKTSDLQDYINYYNVVNSFINQNSQPNDDFANEFYSRRPEDLSNGYAIINNVYKDKQRTNPQYTYGAAFSSYVESLYSRPEFDVDPLVAPQKPDGPFDKPSLSDAAQAVLSPVCWEHTGITTLLDDENSNKILNKDEIWHTEHVLAQYLWSDGYGTIDQTIQTSFGIITNSAGGYYWGICDGGAYKASRSTLSDVDPKGVQAVLDRPINSQLKKDLQDLYFQVLLYSKMNYYTNHTLPGGSIAQSNSTVWTAETITKNYKMAMTQLTYAMNDDYANALDRYNQNQRDWNEYNTNVEKYKEDVLEYAKKVQKYITIELPSWTQSVDYYKGCYKNLLDNLPDPEIIDESDPKVAWYTNLWHRINGASDYKVTAASDTETSGLKWKLLEDNLLKSSSWLQYALEQGLVTLEQVQKVDDVENETGLTTTKWASKIFTTCTDIQFVDDETAITRAEAIYTRKLNDIEAKDKKYDNDIKKLDTEHNALQTEYESVKSVVDKNIERSFKAFS